jgi:hypothetical protein
MKRRRTLTIAIAVCALVGFVLVALSFNPTQTPKACAVSPLCKPFSSKPITTGQKVARGVGVMLLATGVVLVVLVRRRDTETTSESSVRTAVG